MLALLLSLLDAHCHDAAVTAAAVEVMTLIVAAAPAGGGRQVLRPILNSGVALASSFWLHNWKLMQRPFWVYAWSAVNAFNFDAGGCIADALGQLQRETPQQRLALAQLLQLLLEDAALVALLQQSLQDPQGGSPRQTLPAAATQHPPDAAEGDGAAPQDAGRLCGAGWLGGWQVAEGLLQCLSSNCDGDDGAAEDPSSSNAGTGLLQPHPWFPLKCACIHCVSHCLTKHLGGAQQRLRISFSSGWSDMQVPVVLAAARRGARMAAARARRPAWRVRRWRACWRDGTGGCWSRCWRRMRRRAAASRSACCAWQQPAATAMVRAHPGVCVKLPMCRASGRCHAGGLAYAIELIVPAGSNPYGARALQWLASHQVQSEQSIYSAAARMCNRWRVGGIPASGTASGITHCTGYPQQRQQRQQWWYGEWGGGRPADLAGAAAVLLGGPHTPEGAAG